LTDLKGEIICLQVENVLKPIVNIYISSCMMKQFESQRTITSLASCFLSSHKLLSIRRLAASYPSTPWLQIHGAVKCVKQRYKLRYFTQWFASFHAVKCVKWPCVLPCFTQWHAINHF